MPYKFRIPLPWVLVSCILTLLSLNLNAQKTVTGKVTGSKDKQPLAGTTVVVKGTNTATQTARSPPAPQRAGCGL